MSNVPNTADDEVVIESRRQATSAMLDSLIPDPVLAQLNPPVKRGRGRPRKDDPTGPSNIAAANDQSSWEEELFREGLLTVMRNREAKTGKDVRMCIDATNEYVKIIMERFD